VKFGCAIHRRVPMDWRSVSRLALNVNVDPKPKMAVTSIRYPILVQGRSRLEVIERSLRCSSGSALNNSYSEAFRCLIGRN
jgi:hypothetical protein